MSWLYGQTWLWYLIAFLVGVLLAWLFLVRPQQRRIDALQQRKVTTGAVAPAAAVREADPVTEEFEPVTEQFEPVTEQIAAVDPALSTLDSAKAAHDDTVAKVDAQDPSGTTAVGEVGHAVAADMPAEASDAAAESTPAAAGAGVDGTAASAGPSAAAPGAAAVAVGGATVLAAAAVPGQAEDTDAAAGRPEVVEPVPDEAGSAGTGAADVTKDQVERPESPTREPEGAVAATAGTAGAAESRSDESTGVPAEADPGDAPDGSAAAATTEDASVAPAAGALGIAGLAAAGAGGATTEAPADPPYGPGSARPHADGSSPHADYTIKGNADSMLYHSPESPYYVRTRAEAWFSTAEAAQAAGFPPWNRNRKRAAVQGLTEPAPTFEPGTYAGSAKPRSDGSAPTAAFTIKGNEDSMLYHLPSSPYYGRTRAEVWFSTEADAEAAGFTQYRRK